MLNLKGENSMKVIKTMDGTIQLQKDAHDGKDIIQDIFFETNLISIDSENSKKQYFYNMDTDKKYGIINLPEDQKRFEVGEILFLRPMDMTVKDYEDLFDGTLMLEMPVGQVTDAFSINEKSFTLCLYIAAPHVENPSYKCLVFDHEMHPVSGFDISGDNPFTVMKEVMERLKLNEDSPVSRVETTSVLKRAGYRKWYYTYGGNRQFPFQSGWTEVFATDEKRANQAFRKAHPDVNPGYLNCAFVYSQEEFPLDMASDGNFGSRAQETLIAR